MKSVIMNTINNTFPSFSNLLIDDVKKNSTRHSFAAGEILMRTGQFIKSTVLVLNGKIKVYREGEDGGEFLMYYLQPGQACAISMICAVKSKTSEIMAKVEEDAELLSTKPIQRYPKEPVSGFARYSLQ